MQWRMLSCRLHTGEKRREVPGFQRLREMVAEARAVGHFAIALLPPARLRNDHGLGKPRVAPEFVQHAATPESLSAALLPLLDADSGERAAMRVGLGQIPGRLGGPGASARVAEIAASLIEAKRRG